MHMQCMPSFKRPLTAHHPAPLQCPPGWTPVAAGRKRHQPPRCTPPPGSSCADAPGDFAGGRPALTQSLELLDGGAEERPVCRCEDDTKGRVLSRLPDSDGGGFACQPLAVFLLEALGPGLGDPAKDDGIWVPLLPEQMACNGVQACWDACFFCDGRPRFFHEVGSCWQQGARLVGGIAHVACCASAEPPPLLLLLPPPLLLLQNEASWMQKPRRYRRIDSCQPDGGCLLGELQVDTLKEWHASCNEFAAQVRAALTDAHLLACPMHGRRQHYILLLCILLPAPMQSAPAYNHALFADSQQWPADAQGARMWPYRPRATASPLQLEVAGGVAGLQLDRGQLVMEGFY